MMIYVVNNIIETLYDRLFLCHDLGICLTVNPLINAYAGDTRSINLYQKLA